MDAPAPRRFVVIGHTQTPDPRFPLDDLAGAAGRIDVLARAVTSALCLSHGLRTDTEAWTVIDAPGGAAPRTLRFRGAALRSLNPDERSTAALFRKAFAHDAVDFLEEVHPGLEVADWPLATALDHLATPTGLVLLDRDGDDLRNAGATLPSPLTCILSDHLPLTEAESRLLSRHAPRRVSVGPHWLHGHHAITLVHDTLDRRSAPAPPPLGPPHVRSPRT